MSCAAKALTANPTTKAPTSFTKRLIPSSVPAGPTGHRIGDDTAQLDRPRRLMVTFGDVKIADLPAPLSPSRRLLGRRDGIGAVPKRAKDIVRLALRRSRRRPEVRIHVLPHHVPFRRHLEEPPIKSLVDERIAVGQTLRIRDAAAEEEVITAGTGAVLVFPDDFPSGGIDFEGARKRLCTCINAERPVIEQQDVAVRQRHWRVLAR